MANSFREDSEGVASTVATLFALLCAVLFLQAAVISVIPAREYEAERNTSVQALQALDYIRYAAVGAAVQGGQFSVTIPLGTPATSAFATASDGTLAFNTGIPDYSGAQTDLNSIDQSGSTNFGAALFVANNELISYGVRGKAWVIILLTDGQNTCCPNQAAGDAQARLEAARAKANNITVYTIGLGPDADGALLQEIATGSLRVTLITFVGAPFQAAGSGYAFINAQFLYANTNEQTIIRPDLGEQATAVGNTSAYVQYWGSQGAATPGAVAAVRQPLNQAQARLNWGETNASAGKLSLAKFNVDSAQSQLSAAVTATNQQVTLGNMQSWLGKAVNDQIFFVACLLTQWENWYNGITLTIQSPSAAAWALWFVDAFRTTGALTTYGFSGNTVVLTVNAVDRFTVDERVIQLSTS